MRADSAVEPTKSENITVTWRRSARSSGEALGVAGVVAASAEGALAPASLRRAAMASSSFSRCPTAATPSSFSVSCVRLGRTVSSISFSRNAASYFPRPRLRSQTTTSMMKAQAHGCPASWCPPRGVSSWGAVQSGLGPHRTARLHHRCSFCPVGVPVVGNVKAASHISNRTWCPTVLSAQCIIGLVWCEDSLAVCHRSDFVGVV